jgi:hypothetical protein
MSLGLFVGLITLFTLYVVLPHPETTPKLEIVHLSWVLLLQNVVYLSSLSGILYPGAAWEDPEFGERRRQLFAFPVLVGLCWVGWGLERRRLGGMEGRKGK